MSPHYASCWVGSEWILSQGSGPGLQWAASASHFELSLCRPFAPGSTFFSTLWPPHPKPDCFQLKPLIAKQKQWGVGVDYEQGSPYSGVQGESNSRKMAECVPSCCF